MDKKIVEQMAGKTREEREKLFTDYKSSLSDDALAGVNGGLASTVENPNSDCPDGHNNYVTSMGYVCRGQRCC